MEWMGLNELRERFLTFFESKGHLRLPSASLVPREDASLLLINSGMAPLKKYFMGLETPPRKRVTTCQKCIRTPDIERVGKTSRHGTFFEMLGNFSFGDYFKREATHWAWEFITQELKIPTDRLWVSIFQDDDEAFDIWTKEVGVDPSRIVRLGREDNFWEIGSGPCGLCSEIYFDRGPEHGCGKPDCAVGCDCDRYVEFWNLVFTQFNSDGEGHYTPLDHPNIDTGMGLERLACIMQGVNSLFEVDTVQNIMGEIASIAGVKYKEDEKTDVALRVITDHIRSTVFLVGDGVVPQNEGRGYVLRRLLRRAARFGRLLGIEEPFLYKVCDRVIEENKTAYPELLENADYIRQVIRIEEERFQKTIVQGMNLLQSLLDRVDTKMIAEGYCLPGEDVFKLYDTFGFPLDLTREIARDHGIDIDEEGFLAQMQRQREMARKAREELGDLGWEEDVLAGLEFRETFVGYQSLSAKTQLLNILKNGELVGTLSEGDEAMLLLETTPFYAESGGQVGDTGTLQFVNGSVFTVRDTKKSPTGHILHIGELSSGSIKVGDTLTAIVDKDRRRAIMRNHTAAHLLQAALREVLGTHVHQAGQMVDEHVCRFDFTHFSAVTPQELEQIERKVNRMILDGLDVNISEQHIDQAKAQGALALFDSKYSEIVRVCNISGQSIELCGGTHVSNTAQLGLFKIRHESSVAAGVRRIEAVTGWNTLETIHQQEALLRETSELLKSCPVADIPAKVSALNAQVKALQKQLDEQTQKLAAYQTQELTGNMPQIGPVRLLTMLLNVDSVDALKKTADSLKSKHPDIVGVIAMNDQKDPKGKVTLLAFAGKEAVAAGIHAGKLVQAVAQKAEGSGGGRPDNAMGGASRPDMIDEALAAAGEVVKAQLGL